jgi:hypothetical protein
MVAVTALRSSRKRPKPKPKTVTREETVGSGTYTVDSGTSTVIRIRLNATGRRLLAARYQLPTTLTPTGTLTGHWGVSFRYGVLTDRIAVAWRIAANATIVKHLEVSRVPQGAKVRVLCHGGGCPFARRTFVVKQGTARLTSAFARARLRPRARVVIEVTRTNAVGAVAAFTVRARAEPTHVGRCLVPGASTPSVCVRSARP